MTITATTADTTRTTSLLLRPLLSLESNGQWYPVDLDRIEEYLGWAVRHTGQNHEQIVAQLNAGREVQHGGQFGSRQWYHRLRLTPLPRETRPESRPRFTCPRCGEHRDTTISGHCDDCEA